MSSSARPDIRLKPTISPDVDFHSFPSADELSHRRDSDLSLIIQTDLPSSSSPDSFHTSETTVSSEDRPQQSSSSSSSFPAGKIVTEANPQHRPVRRNSRTFPSLISRISSAAAGGASSNTAPPTRSAQQVTPEAAQKPSRPSPDAGQRDRPILDLSEYQAARSRRKIQQTLGDRDPVAPFQDSPAEPPAAASVPIRQSSDRKRQKEGKRRQLARSTSTRARSVHSRPSSTPADDDDFVNERKMHQTSSRLLRMTDDDRPYTRVSQFSSSNLFFARNYRPPFAAVILRKSNFRHREAIDLCFSFLSGPNCLAPLPNSFNSHFSCLSSCNLHRRESQIYSLQLQGLGRFTPIPLCTGAFPLFNVSAHSISHELE